MNTGPRYRVVRAAKHYEFACKGSYWTAEHGQRMGRSWEGGRLPKNHTSDIERGTLYVQWQQYGTTQRMCEACGRAAGLIES